MIPFAWFLWFVCPIVFGAPVVLNGTAALVGKTLITIEDAQFFGGLQRFREGKPPLPRISDPDAFRRTLQKLVVEEMVFAEMKSLKIEGGSSGDADRALRVMLQKGKDKDWKELLKSFRKSDAQARQWLMRSILVEAFIQKKVETLTPLVTESEAERYYKQNQTRFYGSNFETLKPNIILLLKKERMQKGLEEWIRFLRDKYGVTNLIQG